MNGSIERAVCDLIMRHADMINLGQIEAFANNFTEDGIWEVEGIAKPVGRATIEATFADLLGRFEWVFQGVQGTRIIDGDETSVRARSYICEYSRVRGEARFLFGCYHDWCRFDDGRWRFAHRHFRPLYMGDQSLATPVINRFAADLFA